MTAAEVDQPHVLTPRTALLPPLATWSTYGTPPTILEDGPAFIMSPSGKAVYCHRPRSGHRYNNNLDCYHAWCGASIRRPRTVDRPDPLTPLCGTCEGRAIGAGWPTWAETIAGNPGPLGLTRFTPRPDFDPPNICPGTMSDYYLPEPGNWRSGTCLICHAAVKLRSSSTAGGYNSRFGPQLHTPQHMIHPCRHHAWRYLTWIDQTRHLIGCRCQL